MLHVAHHVERTLLGELGVALDVEAALLRAARRIDQRVGGAGDNFHLDALAVLDVYRRATIYGRGVGERKAVQLDGGLVGTRHVELAVGGGATEVVGDLRGQVAALRDADVCPALRDGEVVGDVAGHTHCCRRAAIDNLDGARGNGGGIDRGTVDRQVERVHLRAAVVIGMAVIVGSRGGVSGTVPSVAAVGGGRDGIVGDGEDGQVQRVVSVVVGTRSGVGSAVPSVASALADGIGTACGSGAAGGDSARRDGRATARSAADGQRVSIGVDSPVIDQGTDVGVAREHPHAAGIDSHGGRRSVVVGIHRAVPYHVAAHGDGDIAVAVSIHRAGVAPAGLLRLKNQVAGAAVSAPLRVVIDIHEDATGHREGDIGEGQRAGVQGGHLAERDAAAGGGQRATSDGDVGVAALRIAAAALQHHQTSVRRAAGHRATVDNHAVVALHHGNLALCGSARKVGGGDGAGGIEYGRVVAVGCRRAARDRHGAAAAVGGDGAGCLAVGGDVNVCGYNSAAIGAVQPTRHAAVVDDGDAVHVDGSAVGGEHRVRALRIRGNRAASDVDHGTAARRGTLVVCAAGGPGVNRRVVAVETAVVARRTIAGLAERAVVQVQSAVRDLHHVVVLGRGQEALPCLGHRRTIA